jgi:SAM-dependent methyltransferase
MLELISGERQVRKDLEGIRADHRARYEWVADRLGPNEIIVDAGCGVGYGSTILAEAGAFVHAYDRSEQAIGFAKDHYAHDRVTYNTGNLYERTFPANATAVCAFEVLEHLADPGIALRNFAQMADTLYVSVPNEDVFPYHGRIKFHHRHYTQDELESLLADNGWAVREWWGQEGPESPVEAGAHGRTLVAVCDKVGEAVLPIDAILHDDAELEKHLINGRVPKSVAILGMGRSYRSYVDHVTRMGGRWAMAEEVWVVNALGGVLAHDRVFHMDDFKIQEARMEDTQSTMVAGMMRWMPHHPHVYTSRAYPDYPLAKEYPLEWVLNRVGVSPYFKGTPPYALAFAIALGVEEIHLYGLDYGYKYAEKRERGRACLEFWCGVAEAKGIKIHVPNTSALMDQDEAGRHTLYGYDTEWVTVEEGDRVRVSRVPRKEEDIPDAAEMARRYSHDPKRDSVREPGTSQDAKASPAA